MASALRPYIPTTVLAFLIFYFGFQALTGDRGLLSLAQRKRRPATPDPPRDQPEQAFSGLTVQRSEPDSPSRPPDRAR